ncbi:hypothetical protein BJX76DRAFT_347042 [Aspergillus varians]
MQKLRDACIERVNWEALLQYASSQHFNRPCKLLGDYTVGGIHLINLLSFGDTSWVARVQLVRPERRETFLGEIVRIQVCVFGDIWNPYQFVLKVELALVRMPKISSITRRYDGSFDIGPLPKLGGPFSSATDFFKAWARSVEFPVNEKDIRNGMRSGPVEEVLSTIRTFPSLLHEIASTISINDTGVIDWEDTCTVLWEMVERPLFLGIMPPAMDDPRNYDENVRPKDSDTKRRIEERVQYVNCIQQWAERLKKDDKLSEILLNPDIQGLAQVRILR